MAFLVVFLTLFYLFLFGVFSLLFVFAAVFKCVSLGRFLFLSFLVGNTGWHQVLGLFYLRSLPTPGHFFPRNIFSSFSVICCDDIRHYHLESEEKV